MKPTRNILIAIFALLVFACTSPDIQKQVSDLKSQQDSILAMLKTMGQQTDFIAKKVGWEPPEDTLPKIIPISHSYTQGAENPVLTIVEFSDFECPYCARMAPVLDSLAKSYPDKIRVIFKHFPLSFHKKSRSAHFAALAAGKQGRFYDFRYKLAPFYRELGDSLYIKIAEELGLDVEVFKKEMVPTPETEKIINEDMELGGKLGVRGTPTVFANGVKAQDRSFNGFVQLMQSLEKK